MEHNRQDIDENLLLQYLLGNADENLCARVEMWLKADNCNREHLSRLETVWLEAGKIVPAPVAVDVDAAWVRMKMKMGQAEKTAVISRSRRVSFVWWAAAASIVLIAGIFAVLKLTESPRIIQVASHGNIVVDTLADGTRITLNKNSFLSSTETFNQHVRKVSFSGEVFFEVKHNAFQPFVVDAGIAKVMVLGT